jgi:hypothetical protein
MTADNWRGSNEEAPAAGWTGMGVHLSDMMPSLEESVVGVQAHTVRRILVIPTGDVISVPLRSGDGTPRHIAVLWATPDYALFAVFGSRAWAEARETQHVSPGGATHFYVRRRGEAQQARRDFQPTGPVNAGYKHWTNGVAASPSTGPPTGSGGATRPSSGRLTVRRRRGSRSRSRSTVSGPPPGVPLPASKSRTTSSSLTRHEEERWPRFGSG